MAKKIQRVLVAIFDIEDYSKKNPNQQFSLVESFIKNLNNRLDDIKKLKPDAFSTGDGAIVSIGRNCKIEEKQTKTFLEFVISFVHEMCRSKVVLKATVNYSELDRIYKTSNYEFLHGDFIQIGDTINIASRILTYCEPKEIMINKTLHEHLRKLDLESDFLFLENEDLRTKHGLKLETFSYIPSEDEGKILYNPQSEKHRYKKYQYFPPVKGRTINFYKQIGLDNELLKVSQNAFEMVNQINITKNLASSSSIFNVLRHLEYYDDDTVYILSREDRDYNFWTQDRKEKYLKVLQSHAKNNDGFINQTRIRVFDSDSHPDDVIYELKEIHKTNSFFNISDDMIDKFTNLSQFIFGFTLSEKYKYAIIPIPDPLNVDGSVPKCSEIGRTLVSFFSNYKAEDRPMKAIIATEPKFINNLISDYKQLLDYINNHLNNSDVYRLK